MGFDEWAVYHKYYINGGRTEKFKLDRDLMYRTAAGDVLVIYKNSEDAISDLGTVPKPLWPVFPRDEYPSAYYIHDMLCNRGNREYADKILLEALLVSNAPNWKAKSIYWAVRLYAMVKGLK